MDLDAEHFGVLKNEFYLLRMTKNMQEYIKGGENASQDVVKSELLAKKESIKKVCLQNESL